MVEPRSNPRAGEELEECWWHFMSIGFDYQFIARALRAILYTAQVVGLEKRI